MLSDEDVQSMVEELTVPSHLNIPDDLRTECPALTPATCRFYELAYHHLFYLTVEVAAYRKEMAKHSSGRSD